MEDSKHSDCGKNICSTCHTYVNHFSVCFPEEIDCWFTLGHFTLSNNPWLLRRCSDDQIKSGEYKVRMEKCVHGIYDSCFR